MYTRWPKPMSLPLPAFTSATKAATLSMSPICEGISAQTNDGRLRTMTAPFRSTIKPRGAATGTFCVNPFNGARVPIYIADYVLAGYGTGAIMAVPAEDQRDYDFAKAYKLDVVRTVEPPEGWEGEAYTGNRNQPEQLLRDGPLPMESLSHKILCPTLAARLAARDEASYNL